MGQEERKKDRFSEILEDVKAGEASLEDYRLEMESALPSSLLESMGAAAQAVVRYAAGEISLIKAESIARQQADLHPNHPFFFHMCMDYALQRGDERETDGYTALTKTKADRMEEVSGEDFIAGLDDVFLQRLSIIERADEDPFSVFTYLDGGSDHLLCHLLVEDILASESRLDVEVLELALQRADLIMPVVLAMLGELLQEMSPGDIPAGFVFLLRIIGQLKPVEALPVLAEALNVCISVPLHETVLALAKTGSAYPDQVSKEMRRLVINPAYGEARLGAIEVLGLLRDVPGNLQFLIDELQGLEPEDEFYRDMFTFLVSAILASSRDEAYRSIDAALEHHRPYLDTRTIYLTMQYARKRGPTKAGALFDVILDEDIRDLRDLYLPPQAAAVRRTLTLAREDALKKAMLENLPTLAEVEEKLRTGRDEPCPCGSGKRFRRCCMDDLLEIRELLLAREEGEGPYSDA
ncbi:MAG: SEC-C domain-containing protein [Actinobacteria bacterium]|nr:SEC-C domain-containing protein [Actinomycetota bacterium]